MKLAVSLCNAAENEGRLLLAVDAESGDCVTLNYGRSDVTSACGLAQDARYLYSACNIGEGSVLAIFDRQSLELEEIVPLAPASDVHSILLDGDDVIAVSTGTDEVLRIPLRGGAAEVLWRASDERRDTHHLNAIAWFGASLLCSGFGPKSAERWSSARDGYVYDITANALHQGGIYHPHSLAVWNGELYLCESSLGAVRDTQGAFGRFDGYTRGLGFAPSGVWVVATSVGRSGALEGLICNPADPGPPLGCCALHICAAGPARESLARIDLAQYGKEVYDVLVLCE